MIFPHEEYKAFSEDKSKRTKHSKTFSIGNGKKKLVCSRSPIHHDKDGQLEDIDLTPKKTESGYIINGPEWDCVVEGAKIVFTAHDGRVYEADSLDGPDVSRIALKGKGIEIEEAWPGVDLYLCVRPRGVEWYKRIKSANAKHSFRWKVPKESSLVHRAVPEGRDAKGNKTLLRHEKVEHHNYAEITETFEKKVAARDGKTRVAKSSDKVHYPVFIDVPDVSVAIGAGSDDAQERIPGGVATGSVPIRVGYTTSSISTSLNAGFVTGLRFGGINIPQGATIDSAYIKTYQYRSGGGVLQAKWYGVDVSNLVSNPWGSGIDNKPKTTANAAVISTTGYTYPPVSPVTHPITNIIQEIISRGDWASGNGLGLVGKYTAPGVRRWTNIMPYEHATVDAPLLEIDYTASGGGGPVIPVFYHHYQQQGIA